MFPLPLSRGFYRPMWNDSPRQDPVAVVTTCFYTVLFALLAGLLIVAGGDWPSVATEESCAVNSAMPHHPTDKRAAAAEVEADAVEAGPPQNVTDLSGTSVALAPFELPEVAPCLLPRPLLRGTGRLCAAARSFSAWSSSCRGLDDGPAWPGRSDVCASSAVPARVEHLQTAAGSARPLMVPPAASSAQRPPLPAVLLGVVARRGPSSRAALRGRASLRRKCSLRQGEWPTAYAEVRKGGRTRRRRSGLDPRRPESTAWPSSGSAVAASNVAATSSSTACRDLPGRRRPRHVARGRGPAHGRSSLRARISPFAGHRRP